MELMGILIFVMLLGPTISGLLMTGLVHGRDGFIELHTRLDRWRVGAVWYLIALLTAPGLVALSLFVLSQFSSNYLPAILTAPDKVSLIVGGLIAGILVGIFEELGWTGFAIPQLRLRHGLVPTALILGFVWGLWHMPLFISSARASQSIAPAIVLAVQLFTFLPAFRVLMLWVYDRTGSLLIAMLMHAAQTATTFILATNTSHVGVVIANLAYTALLVIVAVIVLRRKEVRTAARPVAQRQAS
jgi:membrane protease YdiL (CAAX protease family)